MMGGVKVEMNEVEEKGAFLASMWYDNKEEDLKILNWIQTIRSEVRQSIHALVHFLFVHWVTTLIIGAVVLFIVTKKIIFYVTWKSFKEGEYVVGKHQWRPATLARPRLCNLCDTVLYGLRSPVVTCDVCGVFSHARCAMKQRKIRKCPCKPAAVTSDQAIQPIRHHWVKGNLDPVDVCNICNLLCGSILALSGMKCSWCHMKVHEKCFKEASGGNLEVCNLGRHRRLILPPTSVIIQEQQLISSSSMRAFDSAVKTMNRMRSRPASVVAQERHEQPTLKRSASSPPQPCNDVLPLRIIPPINSTPLLVFVNGKSGGMMGLEVLRRFRSWLNPLQVYDVSFGGPMPALKQFAHVPRLKILVCGGDGTVGWVLSSIDALGLERQPPVAILPLGTGNDLARVLGWGGGYSARSLSVLLDNIENAHVALLDRWKVDLNQRKHSVLNNYLGVGVDAQVALEFHEQRERAPSLFISQFVNKLWYSRYGAKNALLRKCSDLKSKIILKCDEEIVQIPDEAEGVIILNINSYGGGSTLWHADRSQEESDDDDILRHASAHSHVDFGSSSHQDGLLDVVAVFGSLHLGQLQVGLSKAVRLRQCRRISISLMERLPIQIDGEPWQQDPCTIEVSFLRQAFMLSRSLQERDTVAKQVGEVLDWAENTKVITARQRDVLLAEISGRLKEKDFGGPSLSWNHIKSRYSLTNLEDAVSGNHDDKIHS